MMRLTIKCAQGLRPGQLSFELGLARQSNQIMPVEMRRAILAQIRTKKTGLQRPHLVAVATN